MARYTFIARGREGKRGHRVSVDAHTRKEAEELASKKAPGETLELISREASQRGALQKAIKNKPTLDEGPGTYEVTFTVYDGKTVVDRRTTTIQANSKDDAYNKLFSMCDEWRENHSRTTFTGVGYNVIKK